MKVPIKLYKQGGIDCNSEDCIFRKECANHASAGDFRSEGGFTPELSLLSKTQAECSTFDRPIDPYIQWQSLPDNNEDLGSGALVYKEKLGLIVGSRDINVYETSLTELLKLPVIQAITLLKEAGILDVDGKLAVRYDASHPNFPGFGALVKDLNE